MYENETNDETNARENNKALRAAIPGASVFPPKGPRDSTY